MLSEGKKVHKERKMRTMYYSIIIYRLDTDNEINQKKKKKKKRKLSGRISDPPVILLT